MYVSSLNKQHVEPGGLGQNVRPGNLTLIFLYLSLFPSAIYCYEQNCLHFITKQPLHCILFAMTTLF